ncbi:hypothetical protein HOP50_12g66140 [Chloropicon primus]|uniref:Uncharacterized protein n=1 Tax=Chloropicon primus TaxID=1764295 RepID=A0A5B8MUP6_9CHLO|nr:hypothetical protein A3770_12p65950 [Chloropicon primus]UPR03285.1 hypothetical protein HOP50_12g66140 [Chloropicon primus]|eukprot:QDZ24077.1 hypothetical protein A3770_12p65950 [Chloropicon primus]
MLQGGTGSVLSRGPGRRGAVVKIGRARGRWRGSVAGAARGGGGGQEGETSPSLGAARLKRLPLGGLAVFGATVGTALDLIHGRAGVLTYNPAAGGVALPMGAQTSVWVPALLAAFYACDGGLYLLLCRGDGDGVTRPSEVLVRFAVLGMLLQVSAILYENYVPYKTIRAVLALLACANWLSFDKRLAGKGSKREDRVNSLKSLGLSVFAGVAAPLIECLLIGQLHLWSYPRADTFLAPGSSVGNGIVQHPAFSGFPSWVPMCYVFYHPFLFSLAACLQDRKDGRKDDDEDEGGGGGSKSPVALT